MTASSPSLPYRIVSTKSPSHWLAWRSWIEDAEWTADDSSVLALYPTSPRMRLVAAVDEKDDLIGSVVWSEYSDLATIDFYILRPDSRGNGIGRVLWDTAIAAIPRSLTIQVRAVPSMVGKYKSGATPFEGGLMRLYTIPCSLLVTSTSDSSDSDKKETSVRYELVESANLPLIDQLVQYDHCVTRRNRSDLITSIIAQKLSTVIIARSHESKVVGYAAASSATRSEKRIFKVAPIFADSSVISRELLLKLASHIHHSAVHPTSVSATLHLYIPAKSIGESMIEQVLHSNSSSSSSPTPSLVFSVEDSEVTLFSRPYTVHADFARIYVPHNNSFHFDA